MSLCGPSLPNGAGGAGLAQALKLLARFRSVTVLNGHIHQLMQKVEGNVTFHTARSTAFPQPAPGTARPPARSSFQRANCTDRSALRESGRGEERPARHHRFVLGQLKEGPS